MIKTGRIFWGIFLALAMILPADAFNGSLRTLRQETGVYRLLTDVAARYNWKCSAPSNGPARIGSNAGWFEFRPGGKNARWNGKILSLNFAAFRDQNGSWWIHDTDLYRSLLPLLEPETPPRKIRRIILDPGHGGTDPGAKGKETQLQEKRVNLAVAQRVAKHLQKAGLEVIFSRAGDDTVALQRRPELVTAHNADLFVSIHQNSAANRKASGIETFVATPENCASTHQQETAKPAAAAIGNRFDDASLQLAVEIQRRAVDYTGATDRGVKRNRFVVVRESDCPAVLIECGFLSNAGEESRMMQEEWMDRISRAIADGICAFSGMEAAQ